MVTAPNPTRGSLVLVFGLAFSVVACSPPSGTQRSEAGISVLELMSTQGRDLDVGDEIEAALSTSDYVGPDGSYMEAWSLDGKPGDTFSIDLISEEFDAYLYVVGPGLAETLRDDDDGGACHSRIDLTVLEPGTFHVVASTVRSRTTGTYLLRVSEEAQPRAAGSCGGVDGSALLSLETAGRVLEYGRTAYGQMTGAEESVYEDRPVQAWTLEGTAGQMVTVRLESDDYDAYLYLFGPGLAEPLTDDDGGSGLDSEITVTFPESGTYVVGAGALSSGAVGSYTLRITESVSLGSIATADRALQVGSSLSGTLSAADPSFDGKRVQAWALEGRAGSRVTIDLESDAFDSYLYVVGPGITDPLSNDDGGAGLDSRLTVSLPEAGTYRVVAASLGEETGRYSIRVR